MTVWVYPADRRCCQVIVTLNLLNVVKTLLDSSESLVTKFQLKSAESSEILLKNLLFLTWLKETYKVMQYTVHGKKSSLRKESDTYILQSIYFAC